MDLTSSDHWETLSYPRFHEIKLSGIGDAAELSEHGIPLVQDTPLVGKNLQDHIFAHVPFKVTSISFMKKKIF